MNNTHLMCFYADWTLLTSLQQHQKTSHLLYAGLCYMPVNQMLSDGIFHSCVLNFRAGGSLLFTFGWVILPSRINVKIQKNRWQRKKQDRKHHKDHMVGWNQINWHVNRQDKGCTDNNTAIGYRVDTDSNSWIAYRDNGSDLLNSIIYYNYLLF